MYIPNCSSVHFCRIKLQDSEYEFHVKEETENQVPLNGNKAALGSGEDYMYMKVGYFSLQTPFEYPQIIGIILY